MSLQAMIIGLGRFGMSLARSLAERKVEVFAVDRDPEKLRVAAGFAADAVCFDATDADALARTSPATRDLCVCAVGEDSIQVAILCTAMLREMGAPRVVARAGNDLESRILRRVGAHEVVNPLQDFGQRFASHLIHQDVLGEMPLGKGLAITELRAAPWMQGKTLMDLDLPRKFRITVVAVRRERGTTVSLPDPAAEIREDDVLIVVSHPESVSRLMEER